MGVRRIAGLMLAYCLAAVPVDELKLSLLRAGALEYWTWSLPGCLRLGMEGLALSALTELLDGDAALWAFQAEEKNYVLLVNALLPLLQPRDVLNRCCTLKDDAGDNTMLQVLHLSATLAAHPYFAAARGEERLWEAVLEAGAWPVEAAEAGAPPASSFVVREELALPWAAVAAASTKRKALARVMLFDRFVKRRLLEVADADAPPASLERAYALAALSGLARALEAEGAPKVPLGRGRFVDDFASTVPCTLPARPPGAAEPEGSAAAALTSCAVGGLFWGVLRGLSRSSRALRPLWRSALCTSAGALAFESVLRVKSEILVRARSGGTSGGESRAPTYAGLPLAGLASASDLGASFALLWLFVQPGRVPFCFGGWLLGQCGAISWELSGSLPVELETA